MNQLSKDVKTHVILTFSNSTHFITAEQNRALREISQDGSMFVDGSMIRCSTISVVQPIEDYYRDHPNRWPPESPPEFHALPQVHVPLAHQAKATRFRLHGLLIGMKHYSDSRPDSKNVRGMLDGKIKSYEALYGNFDGECTPGERLELNKINQN